MAAADPGPAVLVVTLGFALMVSACVGDSFAEYDVVNNTDQDLLTWATVHDCDDGPGHKEDYLDAEVVTARSTHHYGQANFGSLHCAWVATTDRQIVLADERTNHGATFTVNEPLQTTGEHIPELDQLPDKTLWEKWDPRGAPPLYWGFIISLLGGTLTGIFFVTRAVVRLVAGRNRVAA